MEPDGLFVYGSLREGGARHSWLKRTQPQGLTRAFAPGRLFHLPEAGYPAFVPGPIPESLPPGPGWVAGEFVGYEDLEELALAVENLDAVEGVGEELFLRRLVPVLLDSGHTYAAWAYVFPAERLLRLEREGVELTDGDWAPYL